MKTLLRVLRLCFQRAILALCALFVRRRDNRVALGAWSGVRFVDNARYLAEYLAKNCPHLTLYWVGEAPLRREVEAALPTVTFLEKDKLASGVKLLSCRYFFFTQMHNADISSVDVYRGGTLVYLHHGMPIKKWAADGLNQGAPRATLKSRFMGFLSGEWRPYDYFAISSDTHGKSYESALAYKGYTPARALKTGTPRNDMLFFATEVEREALRKSYAASLGFSDASRVILYLPTYRRLSKDVFSFSALTDEQHTRLCAILEGHNAVIIEKSHMAEGARFTYGSDAFIKFADPRANVQEMLLFADGMISDYSGAYLDFILQDRPVIHYAYDYDHYKNVDSGLYYEIADFAAGAVAYDFDGLMAALCDLLEGKDAYADRRAAVCAHYMTYERGSASAEIARAVLKGNNQ